MNNVSKPNFTAEGQLQETVDHRAGYSSFAVAKTTSAHSHSLQTLRLAFSAVSNDRCLLAKSRKTVAFPGRSRDTLFDGAMRSDLLLATSGRTMSITMKDLRLCFIPLLAHFLLRLAWTNLRTIPIKDSRWITTLVELRIGPHVLVVNHARNVVTQLSEDILGRRII